jgi:hypothetical protein
MMPIDLPNLLAAQSNLSKFADRLSMQAGSLPEGEMIHLAIGRPVPIFLQGLDLIHAIARSLDLPATTAACGRLYEFVGDWREPAHIQVSGQRAQWIASACHQVSTALSDELERHRAFVVGPSESQLIDNGTAEFGEDVVTLFPDLREDIVAAARCRAFGLSTACVMHMMRVGEVGVGALADHLGVKRGASWGVTIAGINDALKDATRIKADPALRSWASETGTYLGFVKDAFRNPAMHPERNFSEEEAAMIYANMRAFMRMLTKRLTP